MCELLVVAFANTRLYSVSRACVERECAREVIVLATTPLTAGRAVGVG